MVQIPSAPSSKSWRRPGSDWLVLDTEHGPIDVDALHGMIPRDGRNERDPGGARRPQP
jgi:2-keto-3-deoxy-L-rhamnonate aldolase RhmA